MSLPATSPGTPVSTSGRPSVGVGIGSGEGTAPPTKVLVRAKMPVLTAVRVAVPTLIVLADGREIPARAGDWIIAQGRTIVDCVGAAALAQRYTHEEGGRLLPATTCDRLEATTGLGSTRTPEDLVSAVERLACIHVGTIKIDFTPGQLEEIHQRATKRGRTIKQELQAVVDRIREEIFWRN